MVKLDIYGGLLGAGKTTLIRQMLASAYAGHKTAVIENEIGKVNLDAELLKDSSICVREITSGCICCTVKGNFTEAIRRLAEQEHPEYIIVEPSGVASLTDVVSACTDSGMAVLNRIIMVADARKQRKLLKVIGKFYLKQFCSAQTVYLNFADQISPEELEEVKSALWKINPGLRMTAVPLDAVGPDTFPEGLAQDMLPRRSGLGKLYGTVRMRSEGGQTFSVWNYEFRHDLRKETLQRLMELFRRRECEKIWRVKGYLKMADGGVRKIDIAYGDQFQEELKSFDGSKTNQLVIIGEEIDLSWLQSQLEALDQGV